MPGKIGKPLNAGARRLVSGAAGGLAAGALLSVLFLALEAAIDEPSDLIKLKRRTARFAGLEQPPDRARGRSGEQLVSHEGAACL